MTTDSKTLVEALVAAQAEMRNPPLDGFNPHFKSKFSTLLAVRDTIIPVMNKHGIAVLQVFEVSSEGTPCLSTILAKGAETFCSRAVIPPPANIQAWAASATYIRRVSLLAIAGVVGDPDADAEDVVRPPAEGIRHSPMPEGTAEVSVEFVAKYLKVFRDGLASRNDVVVAKAAADLNGEDQVKYAAVWEKLTSGERAAIKNTITRVGEQKKAASF